MFLRSGSHRAINCLNSNLRGDGISARDVVTDRIPNSWFQAQCAYAEDEILPQMSRNFHLSIEMALRQCLCRLTRRCGPTTPSRMDLNYRGRVKSSGKSSSI